MTQNTPSFDDQNLDDTKLVTVAEYPTEVGAAVLVSVLRDAGIRAVATGGFTAGFRAEAPGSVKVQTLERDAARAREVISQMKPTSPDEWESDQPDPGE